MGVLIAYLLGILTSIKVEDQTRRDSQQASHSRHRGRLPDGPISVVCVSPTPTEDENRKKKRKERRKTIAFGVQVATLVILLIYSGFTILIWSANNKAARAAKSSADTADKTMKLAYRPRITLLGINPSIMQSMVNGKLKASLDKGRFKVGIDPTNTGPFAARNVRVFRFDNVSPRNQIMKLPYEELEGEPKVIPPKSDGLSAGMTIVGKRIITASELAQLEAGTLWGTFSILLVYDDDFGITHHTEYCDLFTLQPYNDICPWPVQND